MAEGNAILLDDPIDGAAACAAAEAVPEILRRGDHQAGGIVGMKRALAYEVLAGFF